MRQESWKNLTAVLHEKLNYDFYWAVNEATRILDEAAGEEYDDGLEECDDSIEGLYSTLIKCMYINSNIKITNLSHLVNQAPLLKNILKCKCSLSNLT